MLNGQYLQYLFNTRIRAVQQTATNRQLIDNRLQKKEGDHDDTPSFLNLDSKKS
jgi:hypothetical protein